LFDSSARVHSHVHPKVFVSVADASFSFTVENISILDAAVCKQRRADRTIMDSSIFEFQTMMQTVQAGMAGKMIPALQTVSYVLMVICLLLGIYESFAKGGDTRQLTATVFKYVVVAFVVGNWTTFFTDLMTGFNQVAQYIDNSYGAGDLMKDWGKQLSINWNSNGYTSIWNIITSGGAAIVNALEIGIAYIIFPVAVQIFTLIYIFWGAVVYAVGPLVLALAPSRMVNSVAKLYMQNLICVELLGNRLCDLCLPHYRCQWQGYDHEPLLCEQRRRCADADLDWTDEHPLLDLHSPYSGDCILRPESGVRCRWWSLAGSRSGYQSSHAPHRKCSREGCRGRRKDCK
jgi:hypothetical protein